MKRRKVVAMLLAGTLTLSQPLAVFASEDFISDITSEQSGMDTEPDAIAEDTGSSDDAQGEGLPMDNSVNSAQGLINNDETGTADIRKMQMSLVISTMAPAIALQMTQMRVLLKKPVERSTRQS